MTGIPQLKSGLRGVLVLAALAVVFALPAQALASENCSSAGSDPTAAQYCSVNGVQGGGNSGPNQVEGTQAAAEPAPEAEPVATESLAEPVESGSLPFTGLDVGILVIVAAALLGTGVLLRRLTTSGAPRS